MPTTEPHPGDVLSLDLTLLKNNPFQVRGELDPAKFQELKAGIAASGLLQPIAVRPAGPGEYEIVAGHRRVAAFKALQAEARTEEERRRYALIKAHVVDAGTDAEMAIACYVENAARDNLNPFEEGAALAKIREVGGHATATQVAEATGQPERKVRRLLKLFAAPTVVKEAVRDGLMVDVSAPGESSKRERRRPELLAALEFARLHEHFAAKKEETADERTTNAMVRALAQNWGLRRLQGWVESVLNNTHRPTPPIPGPNTSTLARSVPSPTEGTDEPGVRPNPLCTSTSDHVTFFLSRLKSATRDQLEAARTALDDARALLDAQLNVTPGGT